MTEIMIGSLVALLTGVTGWFLRDRFKAVDRRLDRHDDKLEAIAGDYVRKEDWLRETGIARQKQDQTLEKITCLDAKVQLAISRNGRGGPDDTA